MSRKKRIVVVGIVGCIALGFAVYSGVIPCRGLVERRPEYLGRGLDAVLAELGQPLWDDEFTLGEGPITAFRIELLNLYPPGDPAGADVAIRELTWRDVAYYLTLWFHRKGEAWRVLDTCYWHHSVQF